MSVHSDYLDLKNRVDVLDTSHELFRATVTELRAEIEQAYERRTITLHQWHELMEETALLQARNAADRPDGAWWIPTYLRPISPTRRK